MKQDEKCIPFLCKDRNDEFRESFKKMGLESNIGYSNGYVAVPKSHPWYGKKYSEVENLVDVHGGLTFSGQLREGMELIIFTDDKLPDEYWAFGFDTMHAYDNLFNCDEDFCRSETIRLKEQLEMVQKLSKNK